MFIEFILFIFYFFNIYHIFDRYKKNPMSSIIILFSAVLLYQYYDLMSLFVYLQILHFFQLEYYRNNKPQHYLYLMGISLVAFHFNFQNLPNRSEFIFWFYPNPYLFWIFKAIFIGWLLLLIRNVNWKNYLSLITFVIVPNPLFAVLTIFLIHLFYEYEYEYEKIKLNKYLLILSILFYIIITYQGYHWSNSWLICFFITHYLGDTVDFLLKDKKIQSSYQLKQTVDSEIK